MINLIRITEPTNIRLQKLIPLYMEAFPGGGETKYQAIGTFDTGKNGDAF